MRRGCVGVNNGSTGCVKGVKSFFACVGESLEFTGSTKGENIYLLQSEARDGAYLTSMMHQEMFSNNANNRAEACKNSEKK